MPPTADTALVAVPERRFQAFVIDRAIAWTLFGVSAVAAWWWFFREGSAWAGVAIIVATVTVVSLVFAVVLGLKGTSPGRSAMGLRVVSHDGGAPIGVGRALLRTVIVGAGSLPMFGLGLATLAWTAVEDHTRQRRGWHDHVAGSVVIDVRPRPVAEVEADERPRHVVNLTAMKLMPVRLPAEPVVPAPAVGQSIKLTSGLETPEPRQVDTPRPEDGPSPVPPPRQDGTGSPGSDVPAPQSPPRAHEGAAPVPGQSPRHDRGNPAGAAPQAPQARPASPQPKPLQSPQQGPTQSGAQRPGEQPQRSPGPPPGGPAGQPPARRDAPDWTSTGGPAGRHAGAQAQPLGAAVQPGQPARPPRQQVRRPITWRVTFDTGETFVVEGLGIVGRQPSGRPGEPVRHVVPLRSDDMSISKTHAQFHLAQDGALVVTDRGSTNGSLLVRKGVSRELAAGRPATLVDGDRVVFGDRQMKVSRENS